LRDTPPGGIMWIYDALVAQPDRASDYESEGRRFESCRARSSIPCKWRDFLSITGVGHNLVLLFDRDLTVA
jgi:hypothetical protein